MAHTGYERRPSPPASPSTAFARSRTAIISDIQPDLAHRYFRFLGIEEWVARWCQANRELAMRAGLLEPEARRPSSRERRADGRGSDGRRGAG